MVSSAEKDAAVNKAAAQGVGALSRNERFAFEQATHDMTPTGRRAANIADGSVFKKGEKIQWKCRNCGYVFTGSQAPEKCPACAHPKAYFEILADNF